MCSAAAAVLLLAAPRAMANNECGGTGANGGSGAVDTIACGTGPAVANGITYSNSDTNDAIQITLENTQVNSGGVFVGTNQSDEFVILQTDTFGVGPAPSITNGDSFNADAGVEIRTSGNGAYVTLDHMAGSISGGGGAFASHPGIWVVTSGSDAPINATTWSGTSVSSINGVAGIGLRATGGSDVTGTVNGTVTASGDLLGVGGANGLLGQASGGNGNVALTVGSTGSVTGSAGGVVGTTVGAGDVTIDVSGKVTQSHNNAVNLVTAVPVGIAGVAGGSGDVNITTHAGGAVQANAGISAGVFGQSDSGTVTVKTNDTVTAGAAGVVALSSSGDAEVTSGGKITITSAVSPLTVGASSTSTTGSATTTVNADIDGATTATRPLIGAQALVLGGSKNATVNAGANVTVNATTVGLLASNTGSGKAVINADATSLVKSDAVGVAGLGLGSGDVDVDAGQVQVTGTNAFNIPGYGNAAGGVIGVSTGGGNVDVLAHGDVKVDSGLFGVAAVSMGGNATVGADAGVHIDPADFGMVGFSVGGNTVVNADNTIVDGNIVGLLGVNIGNGTTDINGTGSTVTALNPGGIGILGFATGTGAMTIDSGIVNATQGSGVIGLSLGGPVTIAAHDNVDAGGFAAIAALAGGGNAIVNIDSGKTIDNTNGGAGGLGVLAAANNGNAVVSGAGSTVVADGAGVTGIAINGNVDLDPGAVTSNNSTGVFGLAINGGSAIDLHGAVQANGAFGVFSTAVDLGSGSGDSAVNLSGQDVTNDGGIGVFSLALGGHSSVTGGAGGTVEAETDGIISTAIGGDSTVESGAIIARNGSGIISTAIGGDAKATNEGKVTADNGLYGIAAFSIGGDATATANGAIDPPLIGVSSFTIGNGDATSNVNNTVQAWAVGAYAGNIGGGDVEVNVNTGGKIQSDYLGILATNIGPGDTTVKVNGAVGGYTGTATGDDAINITNFINNGNISVTSDAAGTLNAGDDAVDITKLGGSGKIDVSLGADATAADDGVTIFRTLSGANAGGANNISVGLADGKTLTATNGNGIDISTPFANNDISVNVGSDSSVLANNGTAVQVTGFSLLGDNNVTITNAGLVQGDGTLFDPTIRVATDGDVNINNTGTIRSDGGSTFASVIQSLAGGSNTVQNDGTITGNMQLAAFGANTVNNTSSTTWNTSGLNLYVSATGNEVNNTSTGTINAGPFTVFAMIGPTNAINNAGEFNSEGLNVYGMLGNDNSVNNSGSFNVTGFTQFLGGNFSGQNLAFNNNGGVLSMQNGTSGYGFVTPVDLGFVDYGNDIGDVVQIGVPNTTGNSFTGSGYSRYAIDAFLAAATTSESDLLIVNGDTFGVTALQVQDTNAGPGAYNPTGILVAHIEGNSDPDAFYLEGGPIDKGLFTYDLYRVQVSSFDWLLASTPDQTFFELPHLITAAQNMWHNSAGVWLDRTADLRSAATEKCGMMGSIKDSTPVCSRSVTPGAWAKVLGNTTEREQNYSWSILGKTSTFEVKSNQDGYGIVGGYDFGHETANGAWMIGAMGGYVASSLDFDGSTTDVDYRTGLVGAYATWIEGGLFIDGKVMANIGKYEYANYTNTGLSTHDKQDVLSVGGVIDTGYRMNYAGGFIEPGATLSYVDADLDNATIYGTTVNFEDGNSLRGRLGLRVGTSFVSGGHKVEPFIGASAWHEFEADNKATLSSGGYDLTAADDASGTFGEVTGGLNVFSLGADGVSGFVKGNAQFGEDNLRGYAGSAGLRVNW